MFHTKIIGGSPMDELNRHNHLKPLHILPQVEETPLYKVFVDYGTMVNILPCSMMKKLSKMEKDLIPSGVTMRSFIGDKSKTKWVFSLKITVANQTRISAFYVVDLHVNYNILLGWDWIHQANCIPSSPFQLLFFWDGKKDYPANHNPFDVLLWQAEIYDDDVGWITLTEHDASSRPTIISV